MTPKKTGACIIAGCPNQASNKIDIRARRDDRNTIWVRGTGALICDAHATGGLDLRLAINPNGDELGRIEIITIGRQDGSPAPARIVIRSAHGTYSATTPGMA